LFSLPIIYGAKRECWLLLQGNSKNKGNTIMNDQRRSQNVMRFAGLATQWMVTLLIAVWGGHKIDKWLEWKFPVFLILFALGALALSFWQFINELNRTGK